MKILLDTHCWLWWLTTPEKLAPRAQELIMDGRNDIFLSAASSWEIAIKYANGKLPLPEKPENLFRHGCCGMGFCPSQSTMCMLFMWLPCLCITGIPLIVFSYPRHKWSGCRS